MLPVSAAFNDAITAGAVVDVRATVLRDFQPVVPNVRLTIGSTVTLDEAAGSVRQFAGGVADPDGTLRPVLSSDPLAPFGAELAVEIGVQVASGWFEYTPAGVYRLEGAEGGQAGPVMVKGNDRSAVVAHARHEVPWVIAGGTSLGDAVVDMLAVKYPGLPVDVEPSAFAERLPYTPTVFLEGDQSGDPWGNLRDLCAKRGRRLTMSAAGAAKVELVPDYADAARYVPVRTYRPGPDNLVTASTAPFDTSTGIYNVWIVQGQGPGVEVPVRASAEVTDPTSRLYPADFGRRPTFLVSQYLTTVEQCQAVADSMKAAAADPAAQVTFSAAPHPAHEPSDVVAFESDELGVKAALVLARWTLAVHLTAASVYTTRRAA